MSRKCTPGWWGYKIALFHQRSVRRRGLSLLNFTFPATIKMQKRWQWYITRVNFVPQIGDIIVSLISKDLWKLFINKVKKKIRNYTHYKLILPHHAPSVPVCARPAFGTSRKGPSGEERVSPRKVSNRKTGLSFQSFTFELNRPPNGFSASDMDQSGKIRRHH